MRKKERPLYDYTHLYKIVQEYGTIEEMAESLGITKKRLENKLGQKEEFTIEEMINICHITGRPTKFISVIFLRLAA